MKILEVFDFISPGIGGGTVTLISPLVRSLRQRGHEVTIYTTDRGLKAEDVKTLGDVRVYPFHSWLNLFGFQITPDIVSAARKDLKGFDVIHLHCFRSFQNVAVHHYAKKYGVPYVLDTHGSLPRMTKKGEQLKRGLKWIFDVAFGYPIIRDACSVVAETKVGIEEYEQFGVDKDKIVLLSPPFLVEDFAVLPPPGVFRDRFRLKDKRVVMFLGRINWIKGLDFLVESFHELTRLREDVMLAIVGPDDGHQLALQELIGRLNIQDKVVFTGYLGGADKLAALADADVMVQTSVYEQGAWAPFEAVLCNTPIIVSGNSGAGEDVKKIDAGYLVEYGNKEQLKDTIQYVLTHEAEAREKTKKAKEYIEKNLSFAKGIEKYEKLYTEAKERCKR